MEGKFRPLGDRVLVKPESLGEKKSQGGIILTDSAQRGQKVLGEVVDHWNWYILSKWRCNSNDSKGW